MEVIPPPAVDCALLRRRPRPRRRHRRLSSATATTTATTAATGVLLQTGAGCPTVQLSTIHRPVSSVYSGATAAEGGGLLRSPPHCVPSAPHTAVCTPALRCGCVLVQCRRFGTTGVGCDMGTCIQSAVYIQSAGCELLQLERGRSRS